MNQVIKIGSSSFLTVFVNTAGEGMYSLANMLGQEVETGIINIGPLFWIAVKRTGFYTARVYFEACWSGTFFVDIRLTQHGVIIYEESPFVAMYPN